MQACRASSATVSRQQKRESFRGVPLVATSMPTTSAPRHELGPHRPESTSRRPAAIRLVLRSPAPPTQPIRAPGPATIWRPDFAPRSEAEPDTAGNPCDGDQSMTELLLQLHLRLSPRQLRRPSHRVAAVYHAASAA